MALRAIVLFQKGRGRCVIHLREGATAGRREAGRDAQPERMTETGGFTGVAIGVFQVRPPFGNLWSG
jgi:hypothetical protein